jgi:RNA polymerase sigma-70 factor (ECF subfamily)
MGARNLEPEALLAHAGWMRELAASLLGDPAAAEDVVQEAWVAAVRRAPSLDRPLEPWLSRVVRNFAWKRRRSDQRRALHEAAAAQREPEPTPEATFERLELQRKVVEAVAAIDEPLRTTLVLRYLEGRTSAEIARLQAVPEGTVRWRVKRGLEELRARLDVRFGGRESWSALLLPIAFRHEPALAAAGAGSLSVGVPGALAMVAAWKLGVAAAVVAAAGWWWWSAQDVGEAAEPRAPAPVAPERPRAPFDAPPEALPSPLPVREVAEQRPEPAAASAPAAEPEALAKRTEPPPARVEVRFVDGTGAPWSEVQLFPMHDPGRSATSGADGRADLTLPTPQYASEWGVELVARRAGCATKSVRATIASGTTAHLGDVVLGPGSRVIGRAVDDRGAGREGARVGLAPVELDQQDPEDVVRRHGSPVFDQAVATTAEGGGAFALDGVAPGRWRLWGHVEGSRYGWSEPFAVEEGADVFGIELVVPARLETDRITGVVLDPAGDPVPDAAVMHLYDLGFRSGSSMTSADARGRFEIVISHDATYDLYVTDPDRRFRGIVARGVAPGTRDLELRLAEKVPFHVRVRDPEERPIEGCTFQVTLRTRSHRFPDYGDSSAVGPGLYRLDLPGSEFDVRVEAPGFRPGSLEALDPASVTATVEVLLQRARVLRGRVVADGRPVEGATVNLHEQSPGRRTIQNGFACEYEPWARETSTTGADGRFEIASERDGTFWLRATASGWAAGELGPLEPAALGEQDLELELTRGGSIEGRVLLPDGRDGEGTIVGVNHGDGAPRTLRAGAQGRFRFDGLAPGRWQVLAAESEIRPNYTFSTSVAATEPIEWSCEVVAGRTTSFDLDLSRP